ncbi:hypothetical protein [Streptomyces scopuliridis]|uniref:Uncharacterized protein n=1 Tax=Streptomyces scopuliridis TaxID=452529 RepID=A0ACD4ZPW8_9ACTN|nr:hypothetical protein [Streptomyces scopuliridis]WSC00077.1 hypothetical protein OG835_25830 [Streptomyces scopuliridis]
MARHDDWFRIYDSSPVADIDMNTAYRKDRSYDGGATWESAPEMTGEHLRLEMTEALIADLTVGLRDGVVVIQSPHPMGGLIRYTPIR